MANKHLTRQSTLQPRPSRHMNAEPPSNSGVSRNVAVRPDEKNRMWHLEAAIESMKLGVTITDTSGIILFANATYARMHGYSPDQLVGKDAALLANTKHGRSIPMKKTERWERDALNPYEDGSHFPVPIRSHRIETPGGQQAVVTTYEELPTPAPARVRAAGSEYRDSIAAGCAHVGLWDWDLATSSIHFSPYWKSMLGYGDSEIGNHPDEWLDRVHPSDRQRVRAELTFHFEGRVAEFRSEHRIRHADGSYRLMLTRGFAVRNVDGRATRIAGMQIEITNRRNGQPDTAAHALHDALTDLPNRDLLMERVTRAMGRAGRRDDYLFALLSLNLDRFSVVNDSLGYAAGNQLLVATAERLKPGLRPTDAIARTGSDEFAILLDDITDASDATRVANRIQEVLAAPFQLGDHEVFVTACIGIALSNPSHEKPEDVLRDADLALRRAKLRGTARYEQFDIVMHHKANARLQLETDLRWALARTEFCTYYQPIISLETGRISGVEALIRWQHPSRGLLLPGDFLPVAEETGLIIPIGRWVLRDACRQASEWQAALPADAPFTLSVKLSSKQFKETDTVDEIAKIIDTTGIGARNLTIELTETTIMDAEPTMTVLSRLKKLQVDLHVDDFGTGYASLSYLHLFPIDALKIDRAFVSNMGQRHECAEIVRTIKALATNLGIPVVAEGVETAEQLAQIRALRCEYAQGYYFSRPLEVPAMAALIEMYPELN